VKSRFVTLELSDPSLEVDGLRHATVQSAALGRRADCTLWAPAGHGGPLPLVVLLHGVYGSHWAWAYLGAAHHTAKHLIDDGLIPPLALAMPSDGLWGHGSGYVQGPGGDSVGWIVDEVPALAAEALPAVEPGGALAVAGLSMGGLGALLLGIRSAPRFRAVAGLSSITEFRDLSLFVGDLASYGVDPNEHSVAEAVLAHDGPLPAIYLGCGSDDLLIEQNRALHERLRTAGVDTTGSSTRAVTTGPTGGTSYPVRCASSGALSAAPDDPPAIWAGIVPTGIWAGILSTGGTMAPDRLRASANGR
jgi:putative tributyrin esterase